MSTGPGDTSDDIIDIPGSDPGGDDDMATATASNKAWAHREILAGDSAQQARDMIYVYADDARRAYQRRVDTVSSAEAIAHQTANTSRLAQEVAQLRAGSSQPPVG